MEWKELWDKLSNKKAIGSKISEMDEVDALLGSAMRIEEICHTIFDDYKKIETQLKDTKKEFVEMVEKWPGVHLHTSRVKTIESLMEKIITKRHQRLLDKDSGYSSINVATYKNVLTDLVGLRIIINYRGNWMEMHEQILKEFPYDKKRKYEKGKQLPLREGENIQAEIPKVYYAAGDDIRAYVERGLIAKQHPKKYRSIHYTVIYNGFYVEIQMRTIYDEAWSDCDHNYVYKKDDNKSHDALENLSAILAKLTNLSNDIGDRMKTIYDEELIENSVDGWCCSRQIVDDLNKISERMEDISKDIDNFKNKIVVK